MTAISTPASSVSVDVPTTLFIGGEWRPASDGGEFEVIDPSTEEPLATVASATAADGIAAVDAAQDAFAGWAATAPRQRGEILRRAFELMTERHAELSELVVLENGKALPDAKAEVTYAAEFFRWNSEEAVRIDGSLTTAPAGANKILVLNQPVGVAMLITPWNFPAAMATRKIGPALAAGCPVILKPAGETPLTALAMAAILEEAGVPAGVVNVVPTSSSSALGNAILSDQRVHKLSFTGSTEVGRRLMAQISETVMNSSMELGGNAPFIVMADADLDAAVDGAIIAKMRNGGEACTSANRFYAHASIAQEFAKRLSAAMGAMKVGPGLREGTQVGPLVNASTRDKVSELVDGALSRGAEPLTGAESPDGRGYYYLPTVLDSVQADDPILQQEIFGPVAPVVSFEGRDEVVALANNTEYGLVSYIYTQDLGLGLGLAEDIESGMVGLNRGVVSDPAAPFGGVKQSGIGREGAHHGLLEFTETKYIAVSW